MAQLALFDYQQLDSETRIVVQQRTGEIKALMKRTAQDIIDIGQKLIEVKLRLGHGDFGGWLDKEFGWTERTAQRFINVSDKFETYDKLSDLDIAPSALYLLAAPSTPDEARQEIITRAQNGETITYTEARQTVNGYKNPRDTKPLYEANLDAALDDESKPVCQDCGQVYDGTQCPDCTPFDYIKRIKPKTNYVKNTDESHPKDRCQTPYYATDIIIPYIPKHYRIWEPAKGKGFMVDRLQQSGFDVASGDILEGKNFFNYEPDLWDCIITNPPFSTKFEFMERCYTLGKPFALLMPFEAFLTKTALTMFKQYGIELIVPDARIDYEMPFEGYIHGNAPFASMWFTWGFNLPQQINYAEMDKTNVGPLNISERTKAIDGIF